MKNHEFVQQNCSTCGIPLLLETLDMWRNIALDMCFYNIIVIDKKCETKLVAEDLIYKNT